MPINIHWANNTQSIVIQKFSDVWTWDQVVVNCQTDLYPAIGQMSHPVVLIQDMVGSHWTPTTSLLAEVEKLMHIPQPHNLPMIQVVSGEPSVDMLVVSAYKRTSDSNCIFQASSTVNVALRNANDYLN